MRDFCAGRAAERFCVLDFAAGRATFLFDLAGVVARDLETGRDAFEAFLDGTVFARVVLLDFVLVCFFAGVALRAGAFLPAERLSAAGFGRAIFAVLLLLVVDFVTVLYEAGREASLLALLTTGSLMRNIEFPQMPSESGAVGTVAV